MSVLRWKCFRTWAWPAVSSFIPIELLMKTAYSVHQFNYEMVCNIWTGNYKIWINNNHDTRDEMLRRKNQKEMAMSNQRRERKVDSLWLIVRKKSTLWLKKSLWFFGHWHHLLNGDWKRRHFVFSGKCRRGFNVCGLLQLKSFKLNPL